MEAICIGDRSEERLRSDFDVSSSYQATINVSRLWLYKLPSRLAGVVTHPPSDQRLVKILIQKWQGWRFMSSRSQLMITLSKMWSSSLTKLCCQYVITTRKFLLLNLTWWWLVREVYGATSNNVWFDACPYAVHNVHCIVRIRGYFRFWSVSAF